MEKWGRNLSLTALVVLLVVLPFEKRAEAAYQGALVVLMLGFVLRLFRWTDRRFWAVAVVVFLVSMWLFAAIAALASRAMQSDSYNYTAGEIVKELLTQVGALYFCMTLVFLSQFILRPEIWKSHDRWVKTLLGLVWAFALVVLVSAICSLDPVESLRYVRKFLAPYLLTYMIVVETLTSWRHYRIIITTIYLVGIIVTATAVTGRYVYFYGSHDARRILADEDGLAWVRVEDDEVRNQWPFVHHNRLCSYALVVTLFVWLQFFATRNWELKTLVAISPFVPIWCMLATMTRGGWVALAVGAVGLVWMLNWRNVLVLLAVAAAAWWISPHVMRDRLTSVFRPATYVEPTGTFYLRKQIWRVSLEIIGKHPVLGLGAGWEPFQEYVREHYPGLQPGQNTPHAHNNFLQIAAESGLVALALFLAFMGMLVAQVFRAWRDSERQTKRRFVIAGFFALLVSITIYGLTNYSLRYTIGMLIWVCFALMTLLPSIARTIPEKEEQTATSDGAT